MNNTTQHFIEISKLIRNAKQKTLQEINTNLIDLYWNIGQYIHLRVEENVWGKSVVKELAQFIAQQEPDSKGFSDKNLWRMKQFYEVYRSYKETHNLLRKTSWTNNLLIFSKTKSIEERIF